MIRALSRPMKGGLRVARGPGMASLAESLYSGSGSFLAEKSVGISSVHPSLAGNLASCISVGRGRIPAPGMRSSRGGWTADDLSIKT